jgi:hypothetical protein
MKPTLIALLSLFFISLNYTSSAGCGVGYLVINTTLVGYSPYDDIPTFFLDLNDSTEIVVKRIGNCGPAHIFRIRFNGSIILDNLYLTRIKIKNNPGQYEFDIQASPSINSIARFYISDKAAVGIEKTGEINPNLVLAPNPASDQLQISSAMALKSVSIFDLTGKQLEFIPADGNSLTLPLEKYPRGMYLVQVATAADKVTVRKLVVE